MKIFYKDVNLLPNDEYAKLRKATFGASDVASIFGLGFKTLDEVIAQKANPELTEEELAIKDNPSVKKGQELEPLILSKYEKKFNIKVEKPTNMYEIWPGLTTNFDGTVNFDYPVEAKYVTTFGHRNYDTKDTYYFNKKPTEQYGTMKEHIKFMAGGLGIPPYYYTQIQTQIMALGSEYGDLTALFEKDWELRTYRAAADPFFQRALKVEHHKAYQKLREAKGIQIEKAEETFEY